MTQSTNGKRVTLQDIARQTGYSINTVSRALRNMRDISPRTCGQIQEVARQMGYTTNQIASSLRSGRTRTLAVILGNMSNPFYGIMTDSIQDAAAAKDYSLLIMCSREQADLEERLVEAAVARQADGILLFPTNQSLPTVQRLKSLGVPFVLMSRPLGEGIADSVTGDDAQGAYLATAHLIEHGCRKPGYLAHQRIVYSYEKRLEGFERACDEARIPRERRFLYCGDEHTGTAEPSWHDSVTQCLLRWREAGVDGLFVFCDEEAWHVQSILRQTPQLVGWKPGIVSFDNIQGTQHFPIDLCSVDCDFREMARRGIELLRARIHGDDRPPQTVTCPVRIVCRGSCGGGMSNAPLEAKGD